MSKNNTEEPTSWEIHIIMDKKHCSKRIDLLGGKIACGDYSRKDNIPRRCIKSLCPRVYNRKEK